MAKSHRRTFTVHAASAGKGCRVRLGSFTGRYNSSTPAGAAKKAFNILHNKKGHNSLHIEMRETTRGHNGKVHSYTAKRVKLDKPREIMLPKPVISHGKEVDKYVVTHETVVHASNRMLTKKTKTCKK
jgi:hypothetical protein